MSPPLRLSPDDARRIFAYNRAVFERFARRARRLPRRGAFRRRGIGHESLFDTLVHVLNVHEAWIGYILPGRLRVFEKEWDAPRRHPSDWKGFDRYSAEVWKTVGEYLDGATDRRLGRRVKAPWMAGRYTARDALLQTTFEEAHHLGEVIGALWQEDRPSPPMTWIEVGRNLAGAPRRRR